VTKYLTKFNGSIKGRQATQIIKLLEKKKNIGEIRSIDTFSQELNNLIRELTGTLLQPLLKLYIPKQGDIIDSAQFNFMLDRVQDDLIASFEEANNINDVQQAHHALVRDIILKNIYTSLSELESRISLYEILNKNTHGFSQAIFSTFREATGESTVRENSTTGLFIDPRLQEVILPVENSNIDLVGERLTLPVKQKTNYSIVNVEQIFDESCPQSNNIIETNDNAIASIIDNQDGTYWQQSIILSTAVPYIKSKLEFDLGIPKDINSIEIESISEHDIILEAIHYLNTSNVYVAIPIVEQSIKSFVSVQIPQTQTRKILLTFRNINYDTMYSSSTNNLTEVSTQARSNSILDPVISSANVKTVAGITPFNPGLISGYKFNIGFDNIRIGTVQYGSRGIYVSKPLQLEGNGQLGLRTTEKRPIVDFNTNQFSYSSTTYDSVDTNVYLSSLEYWVYKKSTKNKHTPLDVFPILPLGVSRIHHERLLLTQKSDIHKTSNDIGKLIFYSTMTDSNICIYCNGVILPNIDNDALATVGWKQTNVNTAANRTPNNSSPMSMNIQIVGQLPNDIYTASYTPVTSTTMSVPNPPYGEFLSETGLQVVDMIGDLSIRCNRGQLITIDSQDDSSQYFLIVIQRQNSSATLYTSVLENYTLLGSEKSLTRFED